MTYQIDDTYFIEIDRFNHTLKRKSIIKEGENKGKETFYDIGYYTSIPAAIKKWVQLKVSSDEDETVNDLLCKHQELIEHIAKLGEEWEII